jgi:hypothetical protein
VTVLKLLALVLTNNVVHTAATPLLLATEKVGLKRAAD